MPAFILQHLRHAIRAERQAPARSVTTRDSTSRPPAELDRPARRCGHAPTAHNRVGYPLSTPRCNLGASLLLAEAVHTALTRRN
jgi:hypothetical protein